MRPSLMTNTPLLRLLSIVSLSAASGMFFIIGIQNWLRNDPTFLLHISTAVALGLVVFLYCRRLLKPAAE